MEYPVTRKGDQVDAYHGKRIPDPYRWLEEIDSEETKAWIEAQNEVTFGWLKETPSREEIRKRLTALWDYPKYGAPWWRGERYFYFRNEGLQNQAVLYLQETLEGEPRVLIDPNTFSRDGTIALAEVGVSEDGRYLAWSKSISGSDWREWRVHEIDTGRDLPDKLEWSKFSTASWTHDHQGFFYSRYDEPAQGEEYAEANYFHKLYYHRLGTPQEEDLLIHERPDDGELGFMGQVTEDGRYLAITAWKGTDPRNGFSYKRLDDPSAEVVRLLDEGEANYTFVGNDGDLFYFRTDLDAPRGRLIAIEISQPGRDHWITLIPEGDDVLENVRMIHERFVALSMHHAHDSLCIHRLDGSLEGEIGLPDLGSVAMLTGRRKDAQAFYTFTSHLIPPTIFRYDFVQGRSEVFRAPEIEFDPGPYETRQVFVESRDGTRVPVVLVHRKGIEPDGSHPVYLTGYGGFNVSLKPVFSVSRLVWLEMGGIYAEANLRGGGEYGEEWHKAGTIHQKQNVFDDFIAVAEWLVDSRYASPKRIAIAGGSNGGLLVGAALNQRPDLFGAALPAVGVMDMLRFHKFTIGWAWTSDYGSSDDPEEFETLLAYSPYHNIREGERYPATFVTTADHDDRVFPAHSFKYAARLQDAQGGDAPVLIRIQTKAGHGLGKPTAKLIEEEADRWAFLAKVMELGYRPL